MADYTFHQVLVWETNPGGTVRLLRNGSVTVKAWPSGDVVDTVTSDASGQANFTTTDIGAVTLTSPNGLQSAPIVAAELLATAANYVVSEDAAVATLITPGSGSASEAVLNSTYAPLTVGGKQPARKDANVVNVLDHGVAGDGVTLDHVAINATIDAFPGRTILFPAATYLIDATSPNGIKLDQPGTRLLLDPGAVIKVATNAADAYMAVEVTAADCVIEGGTFLGDGPAHTGTTGEWGHLIVAQGGAHRLRVQGVLAKNAWGDGIAIQGNPSDVSIVDVIADDNRRQGLSIIAATRPRVLGGVYKNTGLTKFTAPGAGIDVEPNPSSGLSVTDCQITGAVVSGNRGPGMSIVGATAVTTSVTASGVRAVGNGAAGAASGVLVAGATGQVVKSKIVGCHSIGNTRHGFEVSVSGVELSNCTGEANTLHGFSTSGTDTKLVGPLARLNGQHGIQLNTGCDRSSILGGESAANSQTTGGAYVAVDFQAAIDTRVIGHVARAGNLANKAAYGFLVRVGASTRLVGCDAEGAFTVSPYSNLGTAVAFPVPGVAKQTVSAAATDAATTQTLANSLRTALIALGYAS